ncbi:MAG TPA: dihydropteroate synthase [Gemmatimonadaceae bacterium]|nr:dihydropteroate synthase [Gemmatimonadaceae bacterium]
MSAAAAPVWGVRGGVLSLDRPRLLGIVNVTPDSFSDGGNFFSRDAACSHAERLAAEGADVIDVGGESTRPQGAEPVSVAAELDRVLPVIREVVRRLPGVLVSVDTVKAAVADAALSEGAHIVNDVSGGRLDPRMAAVCARHGAGFVIMHSRGTVRDMATYAHAEYDDVVEDVLGELQQRVVAARAAGVERERIVLDPGVGFSKRTEQSLAMLAGIPRLCAAGYPLLVGASRKRFVGEISGEPQATNRVAGTVGAHVAALMLGARLFRVHDVRPARQSLDVAWAVVRAGTGAGADPT